MNTRTLTRRLTAALLATAMLAVPAMAQGKSGDHKKGDHGARQETSIDVHIDLGARTVLHEYYGNPPGCPPGLAKKNNGCLPPGQAKKRYQIGQPLTVDYRRLPDDLMRRLPPPPSGYLYGRVDDDILLIAEATHKVMDAVDAVARAKHAMD